MSGLKEVPIEIFNCLFVGNSFVITLIIPPVKSAGFSAVEDLIIIMLSKILVGNKSI